MLDYIKQNGMSWVMMAAMAIMVFVMFRKFLSTASDDDIKNYLASNAMIIDVRSRGEYSSGTFPNAVNIPHDQISSNTSRLPKDKNAKIIVFCASGMRSSSAQSTLKGLGYVNVLNAGGIGNILQFRK